MNLETDIFTNKEWGGSKYFRVFNTVLFKQMLLPLVLWNKKAPIKEQGYNGFPQINVSLKFFRINHTPLVIMDGCSKCP